MPTEQEYREALEARVCARCADGDGEGGCRISSDRTCAITTHFPRIIAAVNSVYSPSIEPYEEQLRKRVCGVCKDQSADGSCQLRDSVDCALDRYFPLIVQVIEETQLKKRLHT